MEDEFLAGGGKLYRTTEEPETMNAADRGKKHVCPECAIKYYDLKKSVVACPKCGAKPAPPRVRKSTQAPRPPGRSSAWR